MTDITGGILLCTISQNRGETNEIKLPRFTKKRNKKILLLALLFDGRKASVLELFLCMQAQSVTFLHLKPFFYGIFIQITILQSVFDYSWVIFLSEQIML